MSPGILKYVLLLLLGVPGLSARTQPDPSHDLSFSDLAVGWDEGIPLGNGMLGAMIWKKGDNLRFSLDRADLWDLRTIPEFQLDEWSFSWVYQRWLQPKEYMMVQQLFDEPYVREPAPTKIPAGAMDFNISDFGEVESTHLYLKEARCEIKWKNGTVLNTFVHATAPAGYFRITGLKKKTDPSLVPNLFLLPRDPFNRDSVPKGLQRLGYPLPLMRIDPGLAYLHQDGWGGSFFEIAVKWKFDGDTLEGVWCITRQYYGETVTVSAWDQVKVFFQKGFDASLKEHLAWWSTFWGRSSVKVPDTILEKQYYRDIYKFGASSRRGAPPISLQAVWTTDNGDLPPWKNDFHNDLNTQMSYWPGFVSNHPDETAVFTDWLWNYKPVAEKYTKRYFGAEGLNYPGVCALNAYPLGGWIQYAFSPTVSAWLSQFFYWQYRYTLDKDFLIKRAYPWIQQTAIFLENISVVLPDSTRRLLMSSSPEIYDNSARAWFKRNTNFDLSLIHWLYQTAEELAIVLELPDEAGRWKKDKSQWPSLALDTADQHLLVAPSHPLPASHRHFSHLMSVYPLDLLDGFSKDDDRKTIESSLQELDWLGSGNWCGYSFSWYALLATRARKGERAAEALRTFSTGFCLPNSLHVNGDQSGTGKSSVTDRVFTLEGNMGFAAALQEMLLQSQHDRISIFPAIPSAWESVSFKDLRAQGAFLISAERKKWKTDYIRIYPEKGGLLTLENPFGSSKCSIKGSQGYEVKDNLYFIRTKARQPVEISVE